MSNKTVQDLCELMSTQVELSREMLAYLQIIASSSQPPNTNEEGLSQLRMDMLRFVFNNYSGTFSRNNNIINTAVDELNDDRDGEQEGVSTQADSNSNNTGATRLILTQKNKILTL